jgi:hypothetical protein
MGQERKVLPISLTEDLLWLQIPLDEKIKLLDVIDGRNKLALEHFLLSGLSHWEQDLATFALKKWGASTDHLLWYRLLSYVDGTHITQRVQYTLLEQCSRFCGTGIIRAFQQRRGLTELSAAFHALLFQLSAQRNLASETLDILARNYVDDLRQAHYLENRAIPAAIGWLIKYDPEYIKLRLADPTVSDLWKEVIRSLYLNSIDGKQSLQSLIKVLSSPPTKLQFRKVIELWPSLWTRSHLDQDTMAKAIVLFLEQTDEVKNSMFPNDGLWKFFAGTNPDSLCQALSLLKSDDIFAQAANGLSTLMDIPIEQNFLSLVVSRLAGAASPAVFLELLNLRLRLAITSANSSSPSIYNSVFKEEATALSPSGLIETLKFIDESPEWKAAQPDLEERKQFFDLVFRKVKSHKTPGSSFWLTLKSEWITPKESSLKDLAASARKAPEIYKLCYIQTLGRYKGVDAAALKLLDFVRTAEESEMIAVINSLASIGTARCYQELISCVTRPNTGIALRMEICNRLQDANLDGLQSEIRSAINDLNPGVTGSTEISELIDALSGLLTPSTETIGIAAAQQGVAKKGRDLDVVLGGKIPFYSDLSSEVKRALRTAQFFHDQIDAAKNLATIDLSPVIDMQYKGLELLFRESFEDSCSQVINDGILQRKLDLIGYARPIPRAMDEFEAYLGSVPVIDSIPYFSKFKLRKMLRAICQYRPGRRFTLDGIKAFALFFACFGRRSCRFGLENVVELGFKDDADLCEFVKSLHIFQDFRNRAAHEGFHPDAHNDIDGIWRSTAEIIQNAFKIKQFFHTGLKTGHIGASKSTPVIERKVNSEKAS